MKLPLKHTLALISLAAVAAFLSVLSPVAAQTLGYPTTSTVIVLDPGLLSGEGVTLIGMVAPAESNASVPSGTMEFFDGPNSLGTATLEDANGVATASLIIQVEPGFYNIHAEYTGDDAFEWSASSPSMPVHVVEE